MLVIFGIWSTDVKKRLSANIKKGKAKSAPSPHPPQTPQDINGFTGTNWADFIGKMGISFRSSLILAKNIVVNGGSKMVFCGDSFIKKFSSGVHIKVLNILSQRFSYFFPVFGFF